MRPRRLRVGDVSSRCHAPPACTHPPPAETPRADSMALLGRRRRSSGDGQAGPSEAQAEVSRHMYLGGESGTPKCNGARAGPRWGRATPPPPPTRSRRPALAPPLFSHCCCLVVLVQRWRSCPARRSCCKWGARTGCRYYRSKVRTLAGRGGGAGLAARRVHNPPTLVPPPPPGLVLCPGDALPLRLGHASDRALLRAALAAPPPLTRLLAVVCCRQWLGSQLHICGVGCVVVVRKVAVDSGVALATGWFGRASRPSRGGRLTACVGQA